jgi:hypothetical protein
MRGSEDGRGMAKTDEGYRRRTRDREDRQGMAKTDDSELRHCKKAGKATTLTIVEASQHQE